MVLLYYTSLVSPSCLTIHRSIPILKMKVGRKWQEDRNQQGGNGDGFDPNTLYTCMLLNKIFRNRIHIQSSPAFSSLVYLLCPCVCTFQFQSISQQAPWTVKKDPALFFSCICNGSSTYSELKSLQCLL